MTIGKETPFNIPYLNYLTLSEQQVNQGRLNETTILEDLSKRKVVCKKRIRGIEVIYQKYLTDELGQVGFLKYGGGFLFRTSDQIFSFMMEALASGLSVVSPVVVGDNFLLLPFVDGQDLRTLLKNGDISNVESALGDILHAHQKDIVYGDRWPKNTIVTPEHKIVQIDFDIEYTGPYSKELELAQFLFAVIRDTPHKKDAVNRLISAISPKEANMYDIAKVAEFILGYVNGCYPPSNTHMDEATHEYVAMLLSRLLPKDELNKVK